MIPSAAMDTTLPRAEVDRLIDGVLAEMDEGWEPVGAMEPRGEGEVSSDEDLPGFLRGRCGVAGASRTAL